DDLSRLDCPADAAAFQGAARGKLATLAKALRERPGLSLALQGRADPKRDREALQSFAIGRVGVGDDALLSLARRRGLVAQEALARAEPSAARRVRLAT